LRAGSELRARLAAFKILERVESAGAWAEPLLERSETELGDRRDSGLLHELVLGVLRRRRLLDSVLDSVASRSPQRMDRPVRTALRIGAYSLLFLDRVPAFASVDTAVELVRRARGSGAAAFANAILRRIAREGRALLPAPPSEGDVEGAALHHSHPTWWVARLVDRYGWKAALARLEANNRPASVVVRPNPLRTSVEALAHELDSEGVRTVPARFVPGALRVVSGVAQRTRAFERGRFWIQDEASQLVVELFGNPLGRMAADLCAAPGTKTLALASRLPEGGLLVSSDRHLGRLGRLAKVLGRFGLEDKVLLVVADAARRPAFRAGFDAILVDAPCSGTGTLGRHPELRWRISPADLPRLASRQASLLETAASLLRPGGELVYAVCSVEFEEGPAVVSDFLARHPNFELGSAAERLPEPARGVVSAAGWVDTAAAPDVDGFYAALLVRKR